MKQKTILSIEGNVMYIKEQKEIKITCDVYTKKWYKSILLALYKSNKCFADLKQGLTENGKTITSKILTAALKELMKERLITQVDSSTSAEQKDYTLTAHGKTLIPIILGENKWAATHVVFMNP